MRIISGSAKGRKILAPEGEGTRPTGDKVKGAIFNIMQNRIVDAVVLDMFAGTGNLGLEALSRGAEKCIFFEKDRKAYDVLRKNISVLGFSECCEVYQQDSFSVLDKLKRRGVKLDIVFLDPPYGKGMVIQAVKLIAQYHVLRNDGIIVSEHDENDILPERVDYIKAYRTERYGRTKITFWRVEEEN